VNSPLLILDASLEAVGPESDWHDRVEKSLDQSTASWIEAVETIGGLSDEHAWIMLAFIEGSATQIARTAARSKLVVAVIAMAVVLRSALDRRDCSLVASLLRRAAALAEIDYLSAVDEGLARAGESTQEARALLLGAAAVTPATHIEQGSGNTFAFRRLSSEFDVDDLERWLEGG
jgi:hypothetical protein